MGATRTRRRKPSPAVPQTTPPERESELRFARATLDHYRRSSAHDGGRNAEIYAYVLDARPWLIERGKRSNRTSVALRGTARVDGWPSARRSRWRS